MVIFFVLYIAIYFYDQLQLLKGLLYVIYSLFLGVGVGIVLWVVLCVSLLVVFNVFYFGYHWICLLNWLVGVGKELCSEVAHKILHSIFISSTWLLLILRRKKICRGMCQTAKLYKTKMKRSNYVSNVIMVVLRDSPTICEGCIKICCLPVMPNVLLLSPSLSLFELFDLMPNILCWLSLGCHWFNFIQLYFFTS